MTSVPDTAALARALSAVGRHDVALHAFASLGSTNAWFSRGDGREMAAPAVCVTDHQPAGNGRRGRSWEALPGNLTVSVLQRFAPALAVPGLLSLVTGIALAEVLQDATGVAIRVKWPNDLLIGDSKVGGLLIESRHDKDGALRMIGGIGVNLVADDRLAGFGATSLAVQGVPAGARDDLLAVVVPAVFAAWDRYALDGWTAFEAAWARLDALIDREVTLLDGPLGSAVRQEGIARGIAADGALQVETRDGLRTVYAADVSVRPRS